MVAMHIAELSHFPPLRAVPPPASGRVTRRLPVAMRAWLVGETGSTRGYVMDLSETGARVGGVGTRYPVGTRMLLKLQLDGTAPPLVVRVHVVRFHFGGSGTAPEVALRFLDLSLDNWFEIARHVDRGSVPAPIPFSDRT